MKIEKIVKVKNGYEVYVTGKKFFVYEDVLLKYELLLRKKVSESLVEEILRENRFYEMYLKGLKFLRLKMRSVYEVREYFRKEGYGSRDIQRVIERYENEGYLSDEAYVDSFLHDALSLSLKGPLKIKRELNDKGVCALLYEDKLEGISNRVWIERMEKIVEKRRKTDRRSSEKMFKDKLKAYLYQEGYSYEMQGLIENSYNEDRDQELIKQEIEKGKRSLGYKYSGSVLKSKLRMRLYRKGFSLSEIDEALNEE